MFHVFKQLNTRNRAFVIDNKGNKVFYGTIYQCRKFISFMNEEGGNDNGKSECDNSARRDASSRMDA